MRRIWIILLAAVLLAGCGMVNPTELPENLPTELIPTFIVETLSSRRQTETPVIQTPVAATPEPTDVEKTASTQEPENAIPPTSTPTLPAAPQASPPASTPGADPVQSSSATMTPDINQTPTLTAPPTRRPTRTPTITPTPRIPNAVVQIQSPGPGSKIISPLHLKSWVRSGKDGKVRIELLGEDGRLLARKIMSFLSADQFIYLDEAIDFEIPGVAEAGRLVISTYDTFGRLSSLASCDLLLLSVGDEEINPPPDVDEPLVIFEPTVNKLIQGSTLVVFGAARPFNDQFMLIELIARDGAQVGYRQFIAIPDPAGGYVNFAAEVPFKVDKLTPVVITIKAYSNGRISGMIYAISREIVLSP